MVETEKDKKKIEDKKSKLKTDIENVRLEHQAYVELEKDHRKGMGSGLNGEKNREFFPFTHGDHIERHREHVRLELNEELQQKLFESKDATKIVGGVRKRLVTGNLGRNESSIRDETATLDNDTIGYGEQSLNGAIYTESGIAKKPL